jgi:GNAT superfamily N-acetyltransferase
MIREILPPHTEAAYLAMRELRHQFADETEFVRRVDETQRSEGYRLVGAFEEHLPHAVSVAGFRVAHSLNWNRFLYVDDLSTIREYRQRGHARRLLGWLLEEARNLHCDQLHLDSGVGTDRADAHRLYLNTGLMISAHHFACLVPPGEKDRT